MIAGRRVSGCAAFALLVSGLALAAPEDRKAPAEIFADRVTIDQRTGTSRFSSSTQLRTTRMLVTG